ncbi:MAG: sugar nucleotide-binding protein [Nitrospirae bacterium]|nr:sugar nucleotide-binding protein [Nitrospirota bacterium]
METKTLILDASSYIGGHLFARLGTERAVATYYRNPVGNVVYFDALSMSLSEVVKKTQDITHAVILIGDTKPDSCASDIRKSHALNVESIISIIKFLKERHIKPVFTSTESVFDGIKGSYVETDEVNPILLYGRQKLEIERYLQDYTVDFTILRLSKVYGVSPGDGTIFTSWLEQIQRNETILCSYDQVYSPIYVEDVVDGIIKAIDTGAGGIFHLSGNKPYKRIEMLEMLLSIASEFILQPVNVVRCSINDFGLLEKRPLNVSMVNDKIVKAMGLVPSDARELCSGMIKKFYTNGAMEYR